LSGRLAGKTCLVTAAAQGIGRASAKRFAGEIRFTTGQVHVVDGGWRG
jgi:short-subunit dehydrogenase involved in D-alanine esterification of teichoic acids